MDGHLHEIPFQTTIYGLNFPILEWKWFFKSCVEEKKEEEESHRRMKLKKLIDAGFSAV